MISSLFFSTVSILYIPLKRIRFQKNARRSGIQSRSEDFRVRGRCRENGLEPVSEGTTSTKIFHESSEKRANIVQRESFPSSDLPSRIYSRVFPARFSIASAAKEI